MQTLTPEQRRNWNIDGYLRVEGAFSPGEGGLLLEQDRRDPQASRL